MIRPAKNVWIAVITTLVVSTTFAFAGHHDHALDTEWPSACPDCALTLCTAMTADDAVSVHGCPERSFLTDSDTTIVLDGPACCAGSRAPPATR
ncbi:MAG: hypothetical protein GTN89_13830 [Acidobacteria bacterium]|nr:hypothetical protein [Acidobacteriota bacterium]NIM62792.1 hypothetical protein [Acidobacteriota bacterium]NIO60948.1 hypothetical protein [Acidobacteriota bacterium]NIQ31418.1 hypothetical protein [Acidobacteriota bacterium]NIQ87417.1 hypothetical protein [Acidobacteriota bacterium]